MSTPQRAGLIAAAIYLAIAIYAVVDDRNAPVGFLPNLKIFLATAPFSIPLSWAGFEPDLRSLGIVCLLVTATTALVYRVTWGLTRLFGG